VFVGIPEDEQSPKQPDIPRVMHHRLRIYFYYGSWSATGKSKKAKPSL
jgi:hypothetical protein